jgi:two-component system, chemotaxis family, protein-glutamate methylesterase/glutaminase
MATKIVLVEDSPIAMELLQRLFQSTPEIDVVGTAKNGQEALAIIPKLNPDVVCTDLHMAPVDGLELTKQLMATCPKPILVISNSVKQDDTKNIFGLLQAGAVDIFPKPMSNNYADFESIKQRLVTKIKMLATVKVQAKAMPVAGVPSIGANLSSFTPTTAPIGGGASAFKAIAIGASTGGPQAIHKIVTNLPANFSAPIICAQHISDGFLAGLISWLKEDSRLQIKIAQAGETPVPGTVYFAPEQTHLELDPQGRFIYTNFPSTTGTCPSVDALFKSVVRIYGSACAAILLTGIGSDGAEGMKGVSAGGGTTIAQDEQTCVVYGMSKAAIDAGAAKHVLPIDKIAPFLVTKIAAPVG